MDREIGELTFLEQLARRSKLPVPEHAAAPLERKAIKSLLDKWGKAVVKPDVLAGKRGKSGAVKVVDDVQEAQRELQRTAAAEVNGKSPRTSYLVQHIPAEIEVYTAITYDSRYLGPSFTVSLSGGMDIEEVGEEKKKTMPVDVYKGLDAYQAGQLLSDLGCPRAIISPLSRCFVDYWDLFISNGMRMCEINPWRITAKGQPYVCDFKAVFDGENVKFRNAGIEFPEYPEGSTPFEEEMREWAAGSYQGQAHVCDLGGDLVLPILFGGGVSTIITETLSVCGGSPLFLSDFGGNPPYERMFRTAQICFKHNLTKAALLLILGGKANNTLIDVTFKAIGDALAAFVEENGPVDIPVVIGRGGPHLVQGMTAMRETLESLGMPYVIFGYDTPVTMVAEYAARLARAGRSMKK